MNIEDLMIALIYSNIKKNDWDTKLGYSFYDQISRGSGFTEKQSNLAIKILSRHHMALSVALNKNIAPFLENPVFRLPIRKISESKQLSVVEHSQHGRVIKAIFPYNEKTVENIRKNRDSIGSAVWDKEEKCWFFALNEESIKFLRDLDNFGTDEMFQNYVSQIKSIEDELENHIPMLVIEDGMPKLKNCASSVPILETTDILTSIFEARKRGIFTWDDTISNFLDSDEVDPLTRDFLKADPSKETGLDKDLHQISEFSAIVKHLLPILVVIPGGNELETMKISCEFLTNLGIANDEMSVLFRLPSTTHENFNNFVKFNELNSPISEKTKVVFVSSKMPKPVLKSKIKFHSSLNLGYSNVHYTMRNFLKNQENSLIYTKEKEIRNIKFGFM